jgi:membrane protease YdiL (CAAX protease family)
VRSIPHPAVVQQVSASQPRLVVLLAWLVAVEWLPSLTSRALRLWPSCYAFQAQHRTAWLIAWLFVQVILTFGCAVLLIRQYADAVWIPRPLGRQRFRRFLLVLLPMLVFQLSFSSIQLQAICDAATYPSRSQSTGFLASLFCHEWQPVADGPTQADLVYASVLNFVGPVLEETVFTGFLLNAIARRYGFIAGSFGVALCFSVWHTPRYGIDAILIPLFFASLTFSAIRVWCGSLLLAVMAHCMINGVIFIPKWTVAALYLGRV